MNDYFIKEVDFDNDWYSLSKEDIDKARKFLDNLNKKDKNWWI